jgi:sphinganine C4-monooxygenase
MRPPSTTTSLNQSLSNLLVAPPPSATLSPLPPLIPPIPDSWILLALPILTYWSLSLFFHYLDTHDLLSQYRLHTPAEVLKRNHVTRREVIREVVIQHVIQTLVGAVSACFEAVPMVGGEAAAVYSLYSRWLWVEQVVSRLVGVDLWALEEKVASAVVATGADQLLRRVLESRGFATDVGDWRLVAADVAYWYLLPVLRLGLAIFILDTWQYFLHRLMHESKWLYSAPLPLSPRDAPR